MLRRLNKSSPYFRCSNYIDGQWVPAVSGLTSPVYFPAARHTNAEPLGHIPQSHHADATKAVDAASLAFTHWSKVDNFSRAKIMRKIAATLNERVEDLGEVIAAECGKVIGEAKIEVQYAAAYFDWYAGEAERINGVVLPPFRQGVRPLLLKKPVGVVGLISPWNFPIAMVARGLAGSLAAGCTTVWKPSDLTPFTGNSLAMVLEECGVPPGVFNVVQGRDAAAIGDVLCNDKRVRKLHFVGSSRVGKILSAKCGANMKRVSMELGGNAPCLIFEDADIDMAIKTFALAKLRNTGQTCISVNRVLVHESLAKPFTEALVERFKQIKMGNSLEDPTVTNGPLITRASRDRVHELVKGLTSHGARVVCGGHTMEEVGPNFYSPTVVDNLDWRHDGPLRDMLHQEVFGPMVPIITFKTEAEAIKIANDVDVGLAAYAVTEDHKRLWRLADELHYGMIGLNEGAIGSATIPAGGVKDSGIGRDGGPGSIDNYLDVKYICKGGH